MHSSDNTTRCTTGDANVPLQCGRSMCCLSSCCSGRCHHVYCCWLHHFSESSFTFTPAMEKLVREILTELATPPFLGFPDWDAVVDGSRPFHVYCDACIDRFRAILKQEQADCSKHPIVYIYQPSDARLGTPIFSS